MLQVFASVTPFAGRRHLCARAPIFPPKPPFNKARQSRNFLRIFFVKIFFYYAPPLASHLFPRRLLRRHLNKKKCSWGGKSALRWAAPALSTPYPPPRAPSIRAPSGRQGGGRRGAAFISRPPTPPSGGVQKKCSVNYSGISCRKPYPYCPHTGGQYGSGGASPHFFCSASLHAKKKSLVPRFFSCHSVCIVAKKILQ